MRYTVTVVLLVFGLGCTAQIKKPSSVNADDGGERLCKQEEDAYIRPALKIIDKYAKQLRDSGHLADDHVDTASILGIYGWHTAKHCYFGAYTFSKKAFQQAERSWWVHGRIKAGTDILVARDAKFDKSVIGHRVGPIYLGELVYDPHTKDHENLLHANDFLVNAKVVEMLNDVMVRLNKKAPYDGEQYGLAILPLDYVDMCRCTVEESSRELKAIIDSR